MRILLITPSLDKERSRFLRTPQLTLGVISALTPAEIEVDTVDEEIDYRSVCERLKNDFRGRTQTCKSAH